MLRLAELEPSAFQPFGQVLRAGPGRIAFPEATATGDVPGAAVLSVARAEPVSPDTPLRLLERHPHANQTFVPIVAGRWLVACAPDAPDGSPDLSGIVAFVAGPEDAICIRKRVWHAPMTVFDRPADMVMLMWRSAAGPSADTEIFDIPEPLVLALP